MADNSILLSIFSFALGGIGSAYASHVFTNKRWYKEYRLKKLEELFTSSKIHCDEFLDFCVACIENVNGKVNVKKERDAAKATAYHSLVMIVNVYFQELKPALQNIEDIKNDIQKLYSEWGSSKIGKADCTKQLGDKLLELNKAEFEMQRHIFCVAEDIRKEGSFTYWIKWIGNL